METHLMVNMVNSKRTRRSIKRGQIVNAAKQLFSDFGSRRVTVEEICREAGASKMTFYKYFPNKVGLVRSIRDEWVADGFRKFDEINAMEIPFPEKINLMTRWKVEFTSRVNAKFIRELVSIDDVMDQAKHRFLNNIADAQKNGDIRSDIKPEFLMLVVDKVYELAAEDRWKSVFSDFGQFQEQVRALIFFGLLTRS
jgi:AcrR family transcriptional regulator